MAYVLTTPDQREAMLSRIGVPAIADLFESIPASMQLRRPLQLPPGQTEIELTRHIQELAGRNRSAADTACFLGGGSYDHFIPAVVDAVVSRSEYYTAYTPYQAEASQGSLQAFFEYQTLIGQLTGMDVANASLYDGGSAVAEAVLMAMSLTGRTGQVVVAESVHPEYRETLKTYLANLEPRVTTLAASSGCVDPDSLERHMNDETACVVVQHPNFFGCLEEVQALAAVTHKHGALFVVSFDPISLGVLKRPAEYDADIAVAEGQCLGNPMSYGGPYLGILACREQYVRKMPGRLVGQTVDRDGKRCWVLTMQTREQHIRREKATSNICTNQGLMALKAAVYLTALGPQGLRETAELCAAKAHYAARELTSVAGAALKYKGPFFKEFTLTVNSDVPSLLACLVGEGYHVGPALGRWYADRTNCFTVAVTEKRSRAEIDGLAVALKAHLGRPGGI